MPDSLPSRRPSPVSKLGQAVASPSLRYSEGRPPKRQVAYATDRPIALDPPEHEPRHQGDLTSAAKPP
jgi:hypothetical protein